MGMGSPPPLPEPADRPRQPQEDDPDSIAIAKQAINQQRSREGYSAHILTGPKGDTSSPMTEAPKLTPQQNLLG